MQIRDFSGGLATRVDPSLIEINEAVVYTNIDNAKMTLKSSKGLTTLDTIVSGYFYNFKDQWLSSTKPRSYLEYKEVLYFTEEASKMQRFNGSRTIQVGIDKPAAAPIATQADPVATEKISASPAVMQYCYTYYNSEDDIESVPSDISEELSLAADKVVDLSNIVASTDVQVDKIRIYRIGDGITTMHLVEEIDNTANVYRDDTLTLDLPGAILDSYFNYPPPTGCQYLIEAYGILFACFEDKVYYSEIGKPHAWPPQNFIDLPRTLTGLLLVPNGILLFTDRTTDILIGTSVVDFAKISISTEQGCISHFSCQSVKNRPVWVSKEGVCNYNSATLDIVTRTKLGELSLNIINSMVLNEQYHLLLIDGTLFTVDLRFGLCYKKHEFPDLLGNILAFDNTLYGRVGDNLVSIFTGDELELDYLSPVHVDGAYSVTKLYNNIYIRSNGEFTVTVYIDGVEVLEKDISGDEIHDIQIPQEQQRGTAMQLGITGVGTVYEYEYKVVGRQNGR